MGTQQNLTLVSPAWDSVIRSIVILGGGIAMATGKVDASQIANVTNSVYSMLGAGAGLAAAIWGVAHKVANS